MRCSTLKGFVVDGSERSVQDVVSKLKFISKIKEGDIIDVATLTISQRSLATSLHRTFVARSESREVTLNFFRESINSAFDLADEYLKKEEKFPHKIGLMIINALETCPEGLNEHIKTYSDARMHVAKVETLISTIKVKLEEINNSYAEEGCSGHT